MPGRRPVSSRPVARAVPGGPARALASALVVLAVLVLGGCTDQRERYCDALGEQQAELRDLSGGAEAPRDGAVGRTVALLDGLREEAPDDLRDEWDTYVEAWQALQRALDRAGADESMFRDGRRPPGMSKDDYEAVSQAALDLRSTRVVEAAAGIEQHAADVCKVNLGGPAPTG